MADCVDEASMQLIFLKLNQHEHCEKHTPLNLKKTLKKTDNDMHNNPKMTCIKLGY